jgi:TonB family protein
MKTPNRSAQWVLALLPITVMITCALAPLIPPRSAQAFLLTAFCALSQTFLIFLWYRIDAQRRGFRRSGMLNISVAAFTSLAIPYYLLRSRGFLGGLVALGLSILLLLCIVLSAGLGVIVGDTLATHLGVRTDAPAQISRSPAALNADPAAEQVSRQLESLLSGNMQYPSQARLSGHQGTAKVKIQFTLDGYVDHAELVQSAGDPDIDTEAVAVLTRLRAQGAKLQLPKKFRTGEGEIWFELPINFSLN